MRQLKQLYFEACLEKAQELTNLALKAKDWSAKKMSFKRAGQEIRMAGKVLNELYEKERRCERNEQVLENNRSN